jgi:hypothetical protein
MKTSRSSSSFSVSVHGFRLRFFPAYVKDNSKPWRLVVSKIHYVWKDRIEVSQRIPSASDTGTG